MREILFRGKRLDNGEWVEGAFLNDRNGAFYICPAVSDISYGDSGTRRRIGCWYKVDPSTVGQYTGLNDKNGNKIFEGDIIKTRKSGTKIKKLKGYYGYNSEGYPQKIPGYDGISEYKYSCEIDCYAKVEYNPVNGCFYLDGGDKFVGAICNEVVGNIHDNQKLLEK